MPTGSPIPAPRPIRTAPFPATRPIGASYPFPAPTQVHSPTPAPLPIESCSRRLATGAP